jgi:hypothetical protein
MAPRKGTKRAAAGVGNGNLAPIGDEGHAVGNRSYAASSTIERGTAAKLAPELIGKSGAERAPCACGCGNTPTSSTAVFLPGHDSRLRAMGKQILEGTAKKSDLSPEGRKYLDEGGFFEGRS